MKRDKKFNCFWTFKVKKKKQGEIQIFYMVGCKLEFHE